MTDEVPNSVPPQSGGEKGRIASGAWFWLSVATAFVVVAGSALLLVNVVGDARGERLRQQSVHQVGHFARQVESVVAYNREVIRATVASPAKQRPAAACTLDATCGTTALLRECEALPVRNGDPEYDVRLVPLNQLWRGVEQGLHGGDVAPQRTFSAMFLLDGAGHVLRASGTEELGYVASLPQLTDPSADHLRVHEGIRIGDETYVAFVEPLDIPFLPAEKTAQGCPTAATARETSVPERLQLAGLVSQKTFRAARHEVGPAYFLWAVLLLSMGVLSLPLAKLWLLGPKAPFGRVDVALFALCACLTALLSTALFFGFVARNRLLTHIERQTKHEAQKLARHLDAQLSSSAQALAAPEPLFQAGTPCDVAKYGAQVLCHVPLGVDVHNWEILFETDARGLQTRKLVREPDHATQIVRLTKRSYFMRAKQPGLEQLGWQPSDEGRERFWGTADIVRSITKNKTVLIVARPKGKNKSFRGIWGIESSLQRPLETGLPPGFEFAIIDDKGEILLHSNNDAYYGQNIFASLDEEKPLRALMGTRQSGPLSVEYLGVDSRAYLVPIQADWSVLVFAPSSLADAPVREMLVLSLVAFGLLVFAGGLAFSAVILVRSFLAGSSTEGAGAQGPSDQPPRVRLFQPDARNAALYAAIGLRGLVVGPVFGLASVVFAPLGWLLLWLAVPLTLGYLAVWALYFPTSALRGVLARSPDLPVFRSVFQWCEGNLPRAYTLGCLGLVSLLIVAPVSALFGAASDQVAELTTRATQDYVARHAEQTEECPGAECPKPAAEHAYARFSSDDEITWRGMSAHCLAQPFSCLLNVLPPFEHPAAPGAGRLYKLDLRAERAAFERCRDKDFFVPERWSRTFDQLSMCRGHFRNVASVPALWSTSFNWCQLLALALTFVCFLGVTTSILKRSLERLLFLRVLLPRPPTFASEGDVSRYFDDGARHLLLATPYVAEQHWQRYQKKLDARGASHQGLCVLDLSAYDEATLKALEANPCRAVVFAAADWRRIPDPSLRLRVAKLLRDYPAPKPVARPYWSGAAELEIMWSECDPDERRVLSQLALRRYVNPHPKNALTLKHLVMRSVLHPYTLTFATQEIADFVARKTSRAELGEQESSAEANPWRYVKVPLTTSVTILLLLIGVSQPDLAAAGLAVPGVAALVPSLLRQLGVAS